MKRLLNTLYVATQGAYLARERECVLVRVERQTRLRMPIHTLGGIVCFGRVGISPAVMGLCGQRNVALAMLSQNGRFLARIHGPVSGNVLLRREQYRRADDPQVCGTIAAAVVAAKIVNGRTVLLRAARDRPDDPNHKALLAAAGRMAGCLEPIPDHPSAEAVRGLEGDAARAYFGAFDHLITAQKEDFTFRQRSRRPPLDPVNAVLSFLYTLLTHDVESALEAVGLDPAVGFLHRDRPGRKGLALDLMEEFRPFLADRLALSLINRRQITGQGFRTTESGAVTMDEATRKQVLVAWQKRKQEQIRHPFLDEQVEVGLLPHLQAMLLARCLRGDLDAYPPFFWK